MMLVLKDCKGESTVAESAYVGLTTSGLPHTSVDATSMPGLRVVETTGGQFAPAFSYAPMPPPEEQEWRILVALERQTVRKQGLRGKDVARAIRKRRYGR